jgi:uncharacterized protein YegL
MKQPEDLGKKQPRLKTLDEILGTDDPVPSPLLPPTVHPGLTHLPVVILLDTSTSMTDGDAIGLVTNAIKRFLDQIANPKDEFHRKLKNQGDFCIIGYGGVVNTLMDWTPGQSLAARAASLKPKAEGNTPMGAAIIESADLLLNRYRSYKSSGTKAFCGLVFNLTDGEPTDMLPNGDAAQRATWQKARDRVALFEAMGTSKNPYAQYVHFTTDSKSKSREILNQFAGESPLFMPTNSEDTTMGRVNFLSGADSFGRFIRFIEMSMGSIMTGGVDR